MADLYKSEANKLLFISLQLLLQLGSLLLSTIENASSIYPPVIFSECSRTVELFSKDPIIMILIFESIFISRGKIINDIDCYWSRWGVVLYQLQQLRLISNLTVFWRLFWSRGIFFCFIINQNTATNTGDKKKQREQKKYQNIYIHFPAVQITKCSKLVPVWGMVYMYSFSRLIILNNLPNKLYVLSFMNKGGGCRVQKMVTE